jgi:hypothetical protein
MKKNLKTSSVAEMRRAGMVDHNQKLAAKYPISVCSALPSDAVHCPAGRFKGPPAGKAEQIKVSVYAREEDAKNE